MDRRRREEAEVSEPHDIDMLRAAMGHPPRGRIERALEEIERQIALEDMVILLIETTQATLKAFFDVLGEIQAPPSWSPVPGEDHGDRT